MVMLSKYSTSGPLLNACQLLLRMCKVRLLTTLNMDLEFYGIVIIIISMR